MTPISQDKEPTFLGVSERPRRSDGPCRRGSRKTGDVYNPLSSINFGLNVLRTRVESGPRNKSKVNDSVENTGSVTGSRRRKVGVVRVVPSTPIQVMCPFRFLRLSDPSDWYTERILHHFCPGFTVRGTDLQYEKEGFT